MRFTLIGALALTTGLATGCATVDSDLQHRGSLTQTATNGLVLFEDGEAGHAAMYDTTCVVDPDGGIAEDVDVNDDREEVLDGTANGDGSTVLARTTGELHIVHSALDLSGWSTSEPDQAHFTVPGVVDAGLAQQASTITALSGCEVSWIDVESGLVDASTSLADMDCEGMGQDIDVDAVTGTAYVDISGSLYAVTPDAVAAIGTGDLFAFSGDELGVVSATSGERDVHFVEADGTPRWSATLNGPVTDVEDLGARGWVAAMVDHGPELGELVILDATTGEFVKSFDLPGTADVVASANGQTVALVLANDVHYYTLH